MNITIICHISYVVGAGKTESIWYFMIFWRWTDRQIAGTHKTKHKKPPPSHLGPAAWSTARWAAGACGRTPRSAWGPPRRRAARAWSAPPRRCCGWCPWRPSGRAGAGTRGGPPCRSGATRRGSSSWWREPPEHQSRGYKETTFAGRRAILWRKSGIVVARKSCMSALSSNVSSNTTVHPESVLFEKITTINKYFHIWILEGNKEFHPWLRKNKKLEAIKQCPGVWYDVDCLQLFNKNVQQGNESQNVWKICTFVI